MKRNWYAIVFALSAVIVTVASWAMSGTGGYEPPTSAAVTSATLDELTVPTYPLNVMPERKGDREGVLLVDTIHFNSWFTGELNPLLSKVTDLGYEIDFFGLTTPDVPGSASTVLAMLEQGLSRADSFLVVAPFFEYPVAEIAAIQRFVDNGGRLVIAADPTRVQRTNELANAFGLNFENDFLFNQIEHDANYRNVIFRNFATHPITSGLSSVVFYTASSITGSALPLAIGDRDTESSQRQTESGFAPMAVATNGDVVAIADATFITPPYHQVLDNDRLLANIADFLTTGDRRFDLGDFPGLLASEVDINVISPDALTAGSVLATALSSGDNDVQLQPFERQSADTVFVGLYADADIVAHHLAAAGVTIAGGEIRTSIGTPARQVTTALVSLDRRGGRNVIVIMADSPPQLRLAIDMLRSGFLPRALVSPNLGLFNVG